MSNIGGLSYYTRGELYWYGLTLNAAGAGPKTDAKVWLAPRAVNSVMVRNQTHETEKFLFYRGVGHADAALRVERDKPTGSLNIYCGRYASGPDATETYSVPGSWLVDVHADGTCAWRSLGALRLGKRFLTATPGSFEAKDYSAKNMAKLRGAMRGELVKAGLFSDEADALLNTWQVSYFKSPGMRFFYICPRKETDDRLPLELSIPAEVTRVMIGRIEVVTPEQRTLLVKIAAGPAPDLSAARAAAEKSGSEFFAHPENTANWNDVITGKKPYKALGLDIPEVYADYLKLGRFRNALVLNEQSLRPTQALNDFISENKLEAYKVADSEPSNQPNATNP